MSEPVKTASRNTTVYKDCTYTTTEAGTVAALWFLQNHEQAKHTLAAKQ